MSENAKTITFVVVGLLAIGLGIISAPSAAEVDEGSLVGTNLTRAFDNPDAAKRLKIVRFDEDTATLREFEVAEHNGLWTIPSKDGYPADAAKQMAEAATSLMDRNILALASNNAGDHEQYGVIDPLSPKLEPGQKGVGTRVTMSDAQNKPLVDLIVGKPVRDAEGQRYVREAGRDAVYIIKIDPAKLSTNFEDWIEKDLLKLKTWDLQQVENKDYSAEMQVMLGPQGRPSIGVAMDPRTDMTLAYNDADAKWTPVKLQKFDPKKGENGGYVDFKLAADEELNADSLNALKNALGDLKIVDVKRKPQGLSQNLKAGEDFMNNREALQDLMSKGFAATASPDGKSRELISSDGELIATLKNGAEYVLRFGNLTNVAGGGQDKEEKAADKPGAPTDKKPAKTGVHRYLFVMARFNKDVVKQPELVKLPDLPAKADSKATTDEPAKDTAAVDAKKADNTKDEKKENTPATPEKGADATKKEESAPAADAAAKPADTAAKPAEGVKKEDATAKKDDAAAKKDGAPDKELEKVIAERQKIEKENQQKLDEYQSLLKKGRETAKDLNLRFGDWYFIVNDDVFHKVRLSSDKIIKKKEKKVDDKAATPESKSPPAAGIPGLPSIPDATK